MSLGARSTALTYGALIAALAALASGCGSSTSERQEHESGTMLSIRSVESRARPYDVRRWVLYCDPPRGTHPLPAAACAEIVAHPHALEPARHACSVSPTENGAFATVRGHIGSTSVDRTVRPGCGATWEELRILLEGRRRQ